MKLFEGNNKSMLIGAVAIVIVVALGFWFSKKNTQAPTIEQTQNESPTSESQSQTNTTGQTTTKPSSQSAQTKPAPAAIVKYTDEGYVPGFDPSITVIYQGQSVLFINNSSQKMWVASDPHPSHTLYPGFDQGFAVGPGGTYEFKFTKLGQWTYHNHADPIRKGTIVVKNR